MSLVERFPKLKAYLRMNPPNVLLWEDTLYVQYKDGTTVNLSLLSKLAEVIDNYLAGKVSEIVIESDEVDVKTDIETLKHIGTGLVAEYLFHEGSGNVLHDSSGNANHGTISGAEWKQLTNGKYVLYFHGTSSDYVKIPESTSIDQVITSSEWYVESIVRFETLDKNMDVVNIYESIIAPRIANGYVILVVSHPDYRWMQYYIEPVSNIAVDKFYYFAFMRENNTVYYYRNNTLIRTITLRESTVRKEATFSVLGNNAPFARAVLGDMALVRIFTRKPTDQERDLLYKMAKIMVPELS